MARDNFHERRENRINYHDEQAAKRTHEATARRKEADDKSQAFWGGQPILVGHHSEGRARRLQASMHNDMRRSFELDKKADYHAQKAASIENNNAIFSDDPEAIVKLREKIAGLKHWQEQMKAANRIIRNKKLNRDEKAQQLIELGCPQGQAYAYQEPDFMGRVGFAPYMLSNNNANIKRNEQRLAQMEADHAAQQQNDGDNPTHERGDLEIVENYEANRLQIIFPGKPDHDTRTILKRRGFKWSPRFTAWQRHLNGNGRHAANMVLEALGHAAIKF